MAVRQPRNYIEVHGCSLHVVKSDAARCSGRPGGTFLCSIRTLVGFPDLVLDAGMSRRSSIRPVDRDRLSLSAVVCNRPTPGSSRSCAVDTDDARFVTPRYHFIRARDQRAAQPSERSRGAMEGHNRFGPREPDTSLPLQLPTTRLDRTPLTPRAGARPARGTPASRL